MRKFFLFMTSVLLFFMMSSCGSKVDVLKNITKQSSIEIQQTLTYYKTRLLEIIGQSDNIDTIKSTVMPLSTTISPYSVRYTRDELPPEYDYYADTDVVNADFIMTTATILSNYTVYMMSINDFEEDTFYLVNQDEFNVKFKVIIEENQLLIEAYEYASWTEFSVDHSFVTSEIIYIHEIDGKIHLQQVRETNEKYGGPLIEKKYYNEFIESGDMLNIMINMHDRSEVYYQNYKKNDGSLFLFTNSEEGLGFNYTDISNNKSYSIFMNQEHQLIQNHISYGRYHPSLSFSQEMFRISQGISLKWNLLDITGWDEIIVNAYDYDEIYNEGLRLLTDFKIEAFVDENTDAMAYIYVSEDQLTENLINLSDYGLSFNAVTLNELNQDRVFLYNHYLQILHDFGFSENMEDNSDILNDLFPFFADSQMIKQLM